MENKTKNAQNEEKKEKSTKMQKPIKQKTKIFFASVFALAVLSFVPIHALLGYPKKSKTPITVEGSEMQSERLLAMNAFSTRSRIKNGNYAFYRFPKNCMKKIHSLYSKKNQAALSLRISVKSVRYEKLIDSSENEMPMYLGFLEKNDFDEKKGTFAGKLDEKILGKADLRNFLEISDKNTERLFDFSIAIEKNLEPEEIPEGFFVYSSHPIEIVFGKIEGAKIGFDISKDVPFFGLPSNGGEIGDVFGADFTGASSVFSSTNTKKSIMPKILVRLSDNEELSEKKQPKKIYLNAGGEVLAFYRFKGKENFTLQTAMLSNPFSQFSLSDKDARISRLLMAENDISFLPESDGTVKEPLETEPGLLPASKKANWRNRDYELYKWEGKDGILLFDTKDYGVQSDFFTRLAFFSEKAGFRGKILTDEELEGMHGYNAHDYSPETLARFFSKAKNEYFEKNVLNKKELLLREILLHNGLIIQEKDAYKAGKGAVVAISQESAPYLRQSLCAHEVWHGLFFTDEDFRNTTAAIFYTADPNAVNFLLSYWKTNPSLNYDTSDTYLIHNEFMAYIMQNPINRISAYFMRLASFNSSQRNIPMESDYVIRTNGRAFEDAALTFESYAKDRWGLECGRVSLVTRAL